MRRRLISALVRAHRWSERAALRLAGESERRCPVCGQAACFTHCYECAADCTKEGHLPTCATGAGLHRVTVRDLLIGGLRCGMCSCSLGWGECYGSRPFDLPSASTGAKVRLSVCVACAAAP